MKKIKTFISYVLTHKAFLALVIIGISVGGNVYWITHPKESPHGNFQEQAKLLEDLQGYLKEAREREQDLIKARRADNQRLEGQQSQLLQLAGEIEKQKQLIQQQHEIIDNSVPYSVDSLSRAIANY